MLPVAAQSIVINEFVASNSSHHLDEDGDTEDWIEIFNSGYATVNLSGYGLSDDPSNPFRWVFPDIEIEPGDFILLWASGKNRTNVENPLHTNFSISASGEPLLLSDPTGTLIDYVPPVALGTDMSYGRQPDGGSEWFYFEEPTPNTANTTQAYSDWLKQPTLSKRGGFYTETIDIAIESPEQGVVILYTLDGTEPDEANIGGTTYTYKNQYPENPQNPFGPLLEGKIESFNYTGKLQLGPRENEPHRIAAINTLGTFRNDGGPVSGHKVAMGHVLRARVIREGAIPSPVTTHSYFIFPEGHDRYSFPVISVVIPEDRLFDYHRGIYIPGYFYDQWRIANPTSTTALFRRDANYFQRGREWEVPGHIEIFDGEHGTILSQNIGYRMHGNSSRRAPLKSLRIYARRAYDEQSDMHYPFFSDLFDSYGRPVDRFKRLIIHQSGGGDHYLSRHKDIYLQTLLRPLGLDHQQYMPVVHFINGEFWGHMNLIERLDRYYIASRYLIDPDDVVMLDLGHSFGVYQGVGITEGTEDDLQEYLDLLEYVQSNDMADEEHLAYVEDRVDIENFILYQMGQIFIGNHDWPHNNIDFWRKRVPDRRPGAPAEHDGRWRWIFVDLENGFGLWSSQPTDDSIAWATRTESWGEDPARVDATILLRNLIKNTQFRHRFINAFCDHINTTFQVPGAHDLLDQFEDWIGPFRDGEHSLRWSENRGNPYQRTKDYAEQRPTRIIQHLRNHFGVSLRGTINLNVSDQRHGLLKINTIQIDANTPGIDSPESPYPYQGQYFRGIPVKVTALPLPGYQFAGWQEYPDHIDSSIEIIMTNQISLTAQFEKAPQPAILSYWNFNDTDVLLEPTYSVAQTDLAIVPGSETEVTHGGGNEFSGKNALGMDSTGRHLRINNPLGSSVELTIPTTGLATPEVSFEIRRSGQGPGIARIDYTTDGINWQTFGDLWIFDDAPLLHVLNFDQIPESAGCENFRIRITFRQGEGGLGGNIRIDNLLVLSQPMAGFRSVETQYRYWRWKQFPDPMHQYNALISGPMADPMETGISNLMRYALGIASTHEAGPGDLLRLDFGPNQQRQILLPFFAEKTDIIYRVEFSPDMINWGETIFHSDEASPNLDENNSAIIPITAPTGEIPTGFYRLRIQMRALLFEK